MTVIYCPFTTCEYNDALSFESQGICKREEIDMAVGDHDGEFVYCPFSA